MKKVQGFLNGLISSASFGMIPLFAVPILNSHMGFMSVLLYRFLIATAMLAITLLLCKQSLRIKKKDIGPLIMLSFLYIVSSVFLLWGYNFMPSGIATTLHFMYPVITTIIMMTFFKEKKSFWRITAVFMSIVGVFFLSHSDTNQPISWVGIGIVLLSAVGYASYLVALGQMKSLEVKGLKLTFYVFLFSSLFLCVSMFTTGNTDPITDTNVFFNLLCLAFIPTIISNLTLIKSIKQIGSTLTSVLGALEPVTAVLIGIMVFKEPFTLGIAIGIILIITAVSIIILKK